MEAAPLTLSARQFPLRVSLRRLVLQRFADQSAPTPAAPSSEQAAVLRWLAAAWQAWEEQFPLESTIADEVRRLKPLAEILAVGEPDFLVPGKHPLHQLLDTLQAAAIGWQPRLGRAGQGLERQLRSAIDQALARMEQPETDLAAIGAALKAGAVKDGARAQRMAQRVIEAEQGRQKKSAAATMAARMINDALEKFEVPEPIGEFLTGPWYESACLALLKFGADSPEWDDMTKTTEVLLDSVRVADTEESDRRQHLFRVVTRLPRELKRSLLSLHHDTDALDEAVALVEFAHLCLLRRQPLEAVPVTPIPLITGSDAGGKQGERTDTDNTDIGQWYLVQTDTGEQLRARIIFCLKEEGQWLFSNALGIAVLRMDCGEFTRLLAEGKAVPLQRGASFSRSLAAAAGVCSEHDLQALLAAAEEPASRGGGADPGTEETEDQEQDRLRREWDEARRLQREREQES
jgi:hypothetical protein